MITTNHLGTVLEIVLHNPPVNALSRPLRGALEAVVHEAASNDRVSAILIRGEGKTFSAGADIAEFASGDMDLPWLPEVLDRVDASAKPVFAAIEGFCLGGGLELALACHVRIAAPSATFALPEVKLGILPGGGGTQRLPRLIGAEPALNLMLSGATITAEKALVLGIIDEIAVDPVAAALERAGVIGGPPVRRTGSLPPPSDLEGAVGARRQQLRDGALSLAPARIVDAVAAIGEDFACGRAVEGGLFEELMKSEAARALQYAFFGERKVSNIPGLARDVRARGFNSVGIVGGGLMGTGIAIALLNADLPVTLVEPREDALAKAQSMARKTILRDVEKGRIKQDVADARLERLTPASSMDALATVDLVIEAVFEDMAIKHEVFAALDRITRPDAILASNTSTLDLDEIAAHANNPSRVVGLHFFSPANIMRLLEVIRGERTAPDVLATAMAFAKRVGKVGVVSGVCDGFIGNRIFEEYLRQAYFLLEEGALPEQIDGAMEHWGFAMGPLRVMDLAGQDIGWAIRKRRAVEQPDRPYSTVIDEICELGRFGQKTGKGVYAYPDGRTAKVDPDVEALIVAHSAKIGVERRVIADKEIVARCLLAMINEGARIVDEGIAYRPVDIDVIFLNGYGFARERGGPMFQADEIGLARVIEQMKAFAGGRNGWAWQPAPLLERLAVEGGRLADLNG